MRFLSVPGLADDALAELAETLTERDYAGGTRALAMEARAWIADCQWDDLTPADIADLTDAQALSGVARKVDGGLEEFITLTLGPPGPHF